MKTRKIYKIVKSALYALSCIVLIFIILGGGYLFVGSKTCGGLVEILHTKVLSVQTDEAHNIAQYGDLVFLQSHLVVAVGDSVAARTSTGYVLGVVRKQFVSNGQATYVLETKTQSSGASVRVVSANAIEGTISRRVGTMGSVLEMLKRYNAIFIFFGAILFWWELFGIAKIVTKREFLKKSF